MKKRMLALALALIMVLGLAACGGKDKGDPNEIVIGDYTAYYTHSEFVTDYDGDDAIAIYFDFTNNSDEDASFLWSMYYTLTQNGTELEQATVFLSEDSFDTLFDTTMEEVAPGETLGVALTYKIADFAAPVEIEFTDLFDKEKDHLTIDMATVKPADTTSAPVEEDVPEEAEETEETEETTDKKNGKFGKDEPENYAFSAQMAEAYGGDWHGMAEFYDCTGDYSDEDELQCEIIARLIFDEDGYCTPYVRLCLSQSEDENFIIDSLAYDEEYDCMLINGELSGKPLDPVESFIEVEGEVLYIGAEYDDGSGDVFHILGCLRRLDDQWDYENDYPYLPQEGVDFYMGKSLEEIVELYGYDTSAIPEMGEVSVGGKEEAPEAPAAPAAGGIVELQQLKDWKAWLDEVNCYETEYYKPTYEECIEAMDGIEPAPRKEDQWEEDSRFYKWMTADEKEHIILTVKPDDSGAWRYHSISWSGGLNG